MKLTAHTPSEAEVQASICRYLDAAHPQVFYYHVPNGQVLSGVVRGALGADKAKAVIFKLINGLKRIGMRKGIPDLVLHWADGQTAYIECKAKGGKLTPEQDEVMWRLSQAGIPNAFVHSLDDFIAFTKIYLKNF